MGHGKGRIVALMLALLLLLAPAAGRAAALDPALMCDLETSRQEQSSGLPPHLLKAISIVESGRWDPRLQASFAWPWTVTAEGKGRYLPSKAAAIAEVLALKARGVTNIDVGCMQINLRAHPNAFANLNEAFDPATNVAYAVKFLKQLHAKSGSWQTAASHYHSQTPHLAAAYQARLLRALNATKRDGGQPGVMLAAIPSMRDSRAIDQARAAYAAKMDASRAEARTFANNYRQTKLMEYLRRKGMLAVGVPGL